MSAPEFADDRQRAAAIDDQLSHVWMVRRFLKHAEETEDDEELQEIARDLYDFMLAVGPPRSEQNWAAYLKFARKKLRKLRRATDLFVEIQPEVSAHTNFEMAALSLRLAVDAIERIVICPNEKERLS